MTTQITSGELLQVAQTYLRQNRKKWSEISEITGLSTHWMHSVALGRREDPGVNRIELVLKHAGLFPDLNKAA